MSEISEIEETGQVGQVSRKTNAHDVLLTNKRSPAILANMLGCYPENIFQMEQDGRLPPNRDANYIECIKHHLAYLKGKVNAKRTTMGEAKLEQDIRNGKAKEVLQWLEVKEKKESLVETNVLKEQFEPVFSMVNSGLIDIARRYPETQKHIDKLLDSWRIVGDKMLQEAADNGATFVDEQLNKELDIELEEPDNLEDGGFGSFGKYEKRD
jgi:hypothetical protein